MVRSSLARPVRRPLAVAVALAAAVSMSACGGSSGDSSGSDSGSSGSADGLRIGFSPFSLQVPAFKGLADGLTAAAEAQGDTVLTADPKNDPSTQLQQLQQWVQLGQVDAIWVVPVAAQTVAPVVQQAQAKGIVVIASGTPEDYGMKAGTPGVTFTNVDNEALGGQLGQLAAQCITEKLGGNGQIIFLQSPSGQQSTSEINDSIKTALADGAPGATFASELTAGDRLASQQDVSSALQGAPEANVILATDDESTLGGLAAFEQAGKDATQTCVVGAGGNDEAVQAVHDGRVYAEVAFDFQKDLGQNLEELHTLAADPKAAGHTLTTPIQTFTE